ncbi:CU044_2847 family protein [Streptomyces sp. NPDC060366]|uniref:CU044_2847 family protein n=1 Tax=Streptomyces sp. NPDC060366 TaxID=3347105 RepID=UPI0036660FC6
MADLIRFGLIDNESVVVEVATEGDAVSHVNRRRGSVSDVDQQFTRRLDGVRTAVEAALSTLRDGLAPAETKVTFGVKFTAEAGAVIAKASTEGHLTVEMTWGSGRTCDPSAGTPPGAAR